MQTKFAPTPEALMRSRYTAYTLANIPYIQKTMTGKAAENYDPNSSKIWATAVSWLGLTVIDASPILNNTATVIFFARFSEQNKKQSIYEKSLFKKINGRWFYVDGTTIKINRNENCPCGSQKKSKRCCL